MLNIEWEKQAVKELEKIDFKISQRIVKKIDWLIHNLSNITPEPLHGDLRGAYKLRVGDYRIVYTQIESTLYIIAVGHRSEIYKL